MKRQEWEEELNSLDERWGKPYIENYTLNPWSVFGWFINFLVHSDRVKLITFRYV